MSDLLLAQNPPASPEGEKASVPRASDPRTQMVQRVHRFNPQSELYLFDGLDQIRQEDLRRCISEIHILVDPESDLRIGNFTRDPRKRCNEIQEAANELVSTVQGYREKVASDAFQRLAKGESEKAVRSLEGLSQEQIRSYLDELRALEQKDDYRILDTDTREIAEKKSDALWKAKGEVFKEAYAQGVSAKIWGQLKEGFDANGSSGRIYKHFDLQKGEHTLADVFAARSITLGEEASNLRGNTKLKLNSEPSCIMDDVLIGLRGGMDLRVAQSNVNVLLQKLVAGPNIWLLNGDAGIFGDDRIEHSRELKSRRERLAHHAEWVRKNGDSYGIELSGLIDLDSKEYKEFVASLESDGKDIGFFAWQQDFSPDGRFAVPSNLSLAYTTFAQHHQNIPKLIRDLTIESGDLVIEEGRPWSEQFETTATGEKVWKDPLKFHLESLGVGSDGKERAIESVEYGFGNAGEVATSILEITDNSSLSSRNQGSLIKTLKGTEKAEDLIAGIAIYDEFLRKYAAAGGQELAADVGARFTSSRKEEALSIIDGAFRKGEVERLEATYIKPVEEGIKYIREEQIPLLESLPGQIDSHGKHFYATKERIVGKGGVYDLYHSQRGVAAELLESKEGVLAFDRKALIDKATASLEGRMVSRESELELSRVVQGKMGELQGFADRASGTIALLEVLDRWGAEQVQQREERIDLAQQVGWLPKDLKTLNWSKADKNAAMNALIGRDGYFDPKRSNSHFNTLYPKGLAGFDILTGQVPYKGTNEEHIKQLPLFQQALKNDAGVEPATVSEQELGNILFYDIFTK